MALPVKIASVFEYWSIGKLECWKKQKPVFQFELVLSLFHYSTTPAGCRKRVMSIEAPSGGSPKPGSLGPDSFYHYLFISAAMESHSILIT
jgi:hypothetical protein